MTGDINTEFCNIYAPRPEWLANAVSEEAIEPNIEIVDSHIHLWHPTPDYRYMIDEYARDIDTSEHNVVGSVYVECGSMYRSSGPTEYRPLGEVEFAVGMGAMADCGKYTYSKIAGAIVGYADLSVGARVGDVIDQLITHSNGRLRGVRHRAKWDADIAVRGTNFAATGPELYLNANFQRGLAELTKRGLTFDASVFHPQIPDVSTLSRMHPDTTIILNHTGSPVGHSSYEGRQQEVYKNWLSSMTDLAQSPNVKVKLGGMLMPLANFDFPNAPRPLTSSELAKLWSPYIEKTIELFGPERCMVASNFPVDKVAFDYKTVWNMFKTVTDGYTTSERESVLSGCAKQTYQL